MKRPLMTFEAAKRHALRLMLKGCVEEYLALLMRSAQRTALRRE